MCIGKQYYKKKLNFLFFLVVLFQRQGRRNDISHGQTKKSSIFVVSRHLRVPQLFFTSQECLWTHLQKKKHWSPGIFSACIYRQVHHGASSCLLFAQRACQAVMGVTVLPHVSTRQHINEFDSTLYDQREEVRKDLKGSSRRKLQEE